MNDRKLIPQPPTAEWLEKHHVKIIGCRVPKHKEIIVPCIDVDRKPSLDHKPYTVPSYQAFETDTHFRWILGPEDPKPIAAPVENPPKPDWKKLAAKHGVVKAEDQPRVPKDGELWYGLLDHYLYDTVESLGGSYEKRRWILKRVQEPSKEWLERYGLLIAKYAIPNDTDTWAPIHYDGTAYEAYRPLIERAADLSLFGGHRWILAPAPKNVDHLANSFDAAFQEIARELVRVVRNGEPLSSVRHLMYNRRDISKIQVDALQAACVLMGLTPYKQATDALQQLGCQQAQARQLLEALAEERRK